MALTSETEWILKDGVIHTMSALNNITQNTQPLHLTFTSPFRTNDTTASHFWCLAQGLLSHPCLWHLCLDCRSLCSSTLSVTVARAPKQLQSRFGSDEMNSQDSIGAPTAKAMQGMFLCASSRSLVYRNDGRVGGLSAHVC